MSRRGPILLVCAGLAVTTAAEAQTFNYCAFGNSNTCGKYDGNTTKCNSTKKQDIEPLHPDGYPGRLRKLAWLDCATHNCEVYNYGLPGEKTTEGVTRLPDVLDGHAFDVLLLMHGTNDVFNGMSNNTIKFNLGEMDDIASARGVDTVHGSIIRFHPDGEKGTSKDNQVANLRNRVSDLAAARNRYFADPWSVLCPTRSCFDSHYAYPEDIGLHPDASGYNLMATAFSSVIREHDPPAAPTLVSPADGADVATTTVTWDATANTTWYEVDWEPGGSQWVEAQDACSGGSCSFSIPGLGPASHDWRVRGRNPRGRSSYSGWRSFTLYTSPPPEPGTISPDGDEFYGSPPSTFTWDDVDVATNGVTGYRLHIQRAGVTVFNEGVPTSGCNGTVCSYDPAGITWEPGNYRWRVRSENPAGVSAWSSPWTEFLFTNVAPTKPTPIQPTVDTFDTEPVFEWTHEFGAQEYRIQVFDDSSTQVFDKLLTAAAICNDTSCSWKSDTTLQIEDHTWQVRAENPLGESQFSAIKSFTVLACSPPLDLLLDSDTVNELAEEAACKTITAEGTYRVGSNGDLELHAGDRIVFNHNFTVAPGGELHCRVDP